MSRFTTSDGLSLHYEDDGTGKPLLCLAGLTRNARDFDPMADHLKDVRLIRLDYRGRGDSDHDPQFLNYNILREGQDAVELLDHLGLEKVTVLGTSRGGLIAMALAMTQRDRLAGVILNDVGPVLDPAGLAMVMDYVGRRPAAADFDEAARGLMAFAERDFPGVPLAVWSRAVRGMYRDTGTGRLDLRYDPRLRDALLAQAQAGPLPDLWPMFDALDGVPTGVLRGANSNLLSAGTLAQMQARMPVLVAATVPDRGHVPFLDEPQSLELIETILGAGQ